MIGHPAARRSTTTITPAEGEVASTVRHYADASDNPAWVTMTSSGKTTSTAYVGSIGRDLAVTVIKDEAGERASVGLVDPIGSVVSTVPIVDGSATHLGAWTSYDEYGNAGALPEAGAVSYGWLGGKERATDASGLVLMGVRLYNSRTGLFTSVDPIEGGNETVYGYPNDPINRLDLDGRWGWGKKMLKKAWNWGKKNYGTVASVAATAACAAPVVGWASCAGLQTAAYGLRVRQRGGFTRANARVNAADAILSIGTFGLVSTPLRMARFGRIGKAGVNSRRNFRQLDSWTRGARATNLGISTSVGGAKSVALSKKRRPR